MRKTVKRIGLLHPTMYAWFASVAETKRQRNHYVGKACQAAVAAALNLGEAQRVYINPNKA